MELETVLQWVRVFAHIATVLIISSYRPAPDSNHRPGIKLAAIVLCCGSAMMLATTAVHWSRWLLMPLAGHIALTPMFLVIVWPLAQSRGNVAVLFPRRVWSHRP